MAQTARQRKASLKNLKKARAAQKRGRGGGGGGAPRRKPIQRGVLGRLGAFIAGVVPAGIVGVAAIEDAQGHYKTAGNILSTAKIGLVSFVNGFTQGFFAKKAFDKMSYVDKDGRRGVRSMPDIVPPGSLWLVTGSGLAMMLVDAVASKLAGGRPVKIWGTNYNAIGGS